MLLEKMNFSEKTRTFGLLLFMLSPNVLALGSGFLRDLYIISFVNLSLVAIIDKKLLLFFISVVLLLVTRNFMLVLLIPIFLYFYFIAQRKPLNNLLIYMPLITTGILLLITIALMSNATKNSDSYIDIVARIVELQTGFNMILIRLPHLLSGKINLMMETLSHVYFFIIIVFSLGVILLKTKLKYFYFFLFFFNILFAYLYASYLGFFMSRTKLIVLWFSIILILMYLDEGKKNAHPNAALLV
jgi:hypothetical protein